MTDRERVNILMVDDQPAKLLSYETVLQGLDENLIKASSGKQALEELLRTDIAVVLMDVSMRIASISSGVRDHRYEVQSVLSRKLRAIADA